MPSPADVALLEHEIACHPRNPWLRLRLIEALLTAQRPDDAARILEGMRYHPGLGPAILATWRRRIAAARFWPAAVTGSADFLGRADAGLLRPFRHRRGSDPQVHTPGLILPPLIGARNDTTFIRQAAAALDPQRPGLRLTIIALQPASAAGLRTQIAALDDPGPATLAALRLVLPGQPPQSTGGRLGPATRDWHWHAAPLSGPRDPAFAGMIRSLSDQADLILFLDGDVALDRGFLARLLHLPRSAQMIVQPLVAAPAAGTQLQSLLTLAPLRGQFSEPAAAKAMNGLNLAVPSALLARAGWAPDPRFASGTGAARELAYRLQMVGAWFEPLAVPALPPTQPVAAADATLLAACAPSLRAPSPQSGTFEVPRLSVYIPAYRAALYIREAVDSVLDQDFTDLEVCIVIDGSPDHTRDILERHYGNDSRLRWRENANGGIGHASNQAIRMSRSLYIGQLDSDDRLKPGAARRLVERLDANPDLACVYGSCERIDAEGRYLQDEYRWPVFSREKMMVTSIVHHFRMFRRSAWERTGGFREDIANAVDYDIFLKLSETGQIEHIDEILYQRRWHGANTSHVNEATQTSNTHRVQADALERLGLDRHWHLEVPDPNQPRRVGYHLHPGREVVIFWPDYSWSNPYQKLLYHDLRQRAEVIGGDIDAALALQAELGTRTRVTFHLHWLNFLLRDIADPAMARARAAEFTQKLERFVAGGGRLVWTIHNTLSHNAPYAGTEARLSARIADLADVLHLHSAASRAEVEASFALPAQKIRISRHGHYIGAYPNYIQRDQARHLLGIDAADDVFLFTGQIRPYKGLETLVAAFRRILVDRPGTHLVIAGAPGMDLMATISPELDPAEAAQLHLVDRFIEDGEWQLFFNAADFSIYPYHKILTSGSLLLSLSFGIPPIIPRVGMTAEVLEGRRVGDLYRPGAAGTDASFAPEAAMRRMLAVKDAGGLPAMRSRARALGQSLTWRDPTHIFGPIG